jgi:rhamnosyltransferase subunit B
MDQRLKFVVVPMGSAGDVHPLTWLARVLMGRGHEVVMVVQAVAGDVAERAGVPFVGVGDAKDQEQVVRHPDLWHPRKAFNLIARHMPDYARTMIPAIRKQVAPERTVLVAGTLAFAARIVGERWNVPMVSVHLQPSLMMSVEETPVMMAGGEWMTRAPRWLKRGFFGLANLQVDWRLGRPLGRVRREVGIRERMPRGMMRGGGGWWHSPDGVVCLFPEWFAKKAADWPRQAVLTRFPLYDESDVLERDEKVERFMAGGDAPVVITPGSANAQAERFIREAVGAVRKLGRRGMVVTRYPEQVPADLGAGIETFEYVPFAWVFPRAAAVIHHGGIGTTAQCLAAGVPQLIMPMAHDQPDNAARVKRMGVGDYLYPKAFRAEEIARRLKELAASAAVKKACARYRCKMGQQMAPGAVAELIEEMGERALRVRRINGAGVTV